MRSLASEAAQVWRDAVAVAVLGAQGVEDVDDVLAAERLQPGERPARGVEPEDHARVDVLGRADALADGEARLVDELADDPPEHEPGSVCDPFGMQAEGPEEALDRLVAGAGQLGERQWR